MLCLWFLGHTCILFALTASTSLYLYLPGFAPCAVTATCKVIFTYDVKWELDESTTWSERWDSYLSGNPEVRTYVALLPVNLTVDL